MINAPIYNLKGESEEKANLAKEVFGVKASSQLLAQTVRVYLANKRKAVAKTKTRSEVKRTTAKMYKQKGTGKARHGAYSAPIFVGGGVALGPTGEQNWAKKMPKKMIKAAMLGALTEKAENKKIMILTGANKSTGKSKEIRGWAAKLTEEKQSLLLVNTSEQKEIEKAWRNLERVTVIHLEEVSAYDIMVNKQVMMTEEAVVELTKRYAN